MKGWIALDIDGTITNEKDKIPTQVIDFLHDTQKKGWKIVFATGRAFSFATLALEKIAFPYVIFPQNGSMALKMPSKEILFKRYLTSDAIEDLEKVFSDENSDFLIYSGYEKGDFCYFRPNRFSKKDLAYLNDVQMREQKTWEAVDTFPSNVETPLVKCFGRLVFLRKIWLKLKKTGKFQLALIRDPFHASNHLLLITDIKASKGEALKEMIAREGRGDSVIAAGDDENDISLLKVADIKIAMPSAPESVRRVADFIAPPVAELGIVQALQIVIKQ